MIKKDATSFIQMDIQNFEFRFKKMNKLSCIKPGNGMQLSFMTETKLQTGIVKYEND